ncbi:MAG: hypothetical protein UMU75_12715 [Halomonas sp.]|nr:hypothetical protein [Halomonas sp.]
MNTANPTLHKLSVICASLVLAGTVGSNLVMANEPAGTSATGSSHSTMPNDGTSTEGSMQQDCPDDLKEGDECPEGWMPEGSRQNLPEQDGGEGVGSEGMESETGGTTSDSMGAGSGASGMEDDQ